MITWACNARNMGRCYARNIMGAALRSYAVVTQRRNLSNEYQRLHGRVCNPFYIYIYILLTSSSSSSVTGYAGSEN